MSAVLPEVSHRTSSRRWIGNFWPILGAASVVLAYLHRGHPTLGPVGAFGLVFLSNMVLEAAAENVYLRIGAMVNVRPFEPLTLWEGTQYAWPVYNPFLFALVWTVLTALRWYRDENGYSFVERALPGVSKGRRPTTIVRLLAIFAFLEVTYLLGYFLPWNLFSMMRTVPPIVLPSYFPLP